MNTASEILIIGGNGKTGRRVAQQLTALGHPVRIGSRSAEIPFDWNDSSTWAPALRGTRAAYITYQPDLAVPGAVEAIREFSEVAQENGVNRLILLSGRGEEEAERAENELINSGADWTILRASWFAQNFSESFLLDAVREGVVALPVNGIPEPFVDVDDIADIAVAALTEDGHSGQLYEITGPRLMTFQQTVEEIAAASGKPVQFVQVTPEQYAEGMRAQGLPEEVVGLVIYLFTTVLDGRNSSLTDGVQRALGRGPRDFADYARETAATGIWNS